MPIICPKCGHNRSNADDPSIPDYQCPACGIIYSKFNRPPASTKKTPVKTIETQSLFGQKIDQNKFVSMALIFCVTVFSIIGFNSHDDNAGQEKITAQQTDQNRISNEKSPAAKLEEIKPVQPPPKPPTQLAKPSIQTLNGIFSVQDIQTSYEANSVRADADFKNKRIKLTGTIDDINTDLFGNPYLAMKNPKNQFARPQLSFDKSSVSIVKSFDKGQNIMLVCTGAGDVLKTAMFTDCQLP